MDSPSPSSSDSISEDGSSTPSSRTSGYMSPPLVSRMDQLSIMPTAQFPPLSSPNQFQESMQSIDSVLSQADSRQYATALHPGQLSAMAIVQYPSCYVEGTRDNEEEQGDEDEDDLSAYDKLIDQYETACTEADFEKLLSLRSPWDPEDVWCEIEDVVIRNAQWEYLLQLMQKFDKKFDTDFLADIVSSGYDNEHKVCVLSLALHWGWDINSPKSDGCFILSEALDDDNEVALRFLLWHGADPNLAMGTLELDKKDPYLTMTGLPLQDALLYGTLEQVYTLLAYHADPNLANGIHLAIRSDDNEALKIKLLLTYGADMTALEWSGNPLVSALLQSHEIPQTAPIAVAYALGKAHVVQFLLDTSVDPRLLGPRTALPGVRRERMPRRIGERTAHHLGRAQARRNSASAAGNDRGRDGLGRVRAAGRGRVVARSRLSKRGVRMRAGHPAGRT